MSVAWCKIPRLHSFCIPDEGNHFRLRNNHDVDSAILSNSVRGRLSLAGEIPRCYAFLYTSEVWRRTFQCKLHFKTRNHKRNWINVLFETSLLHSRRFYHVFAYMYVYNFRVCSRNECIVPYKCCTHLRTVIQIIE